MEIIKQGEVITSTWVHLSDEQPLPAEAADVTVTPRRFASEREALGAHPGQVGLRLSPSDDLDDLGDLSDLGDLDGTLGALPLVAIEFPKFTDGRGYSLARLLRERHGYRGELRAVGNVLRDQLMYMHRCGFDAFELQPGKSAADALAAFSELSVRYQAGADDPRPLFRRRAGR